jgi:hypothetical protein
MPTRRHRCETQSSRKMEHKPVNSLVYNRIVYTSTWVNSLVYDPIVYTSTVCTNNVERELDKPGVLHGKASQSHCAHRCTACGGVIWPWKLTPILQNYSTMLLSKQTTLLYHAGGGYSCMTMHPGRQEERQRGDEFLWPRHTRFPFQLLSIVHIV